MTDPNDKNPKSFLSHDLNTDKDPQPYYNIRMRSSVNGKHYSGGEEILTEENLADGVYRLFKRGFESPPPTLRKEVSVSIKVDGIALDQLQRSHLLPVSQLLSTDADTTRSFIKSFLLLALRSISTNPKFATQNILDCIDAFLKPDIEVKWGATILSPSGEKIPSPDDGVRTTHIGIEDDVRKRLWESAESAGISGRRFPEALMLASKVIAQPLVHLEVCLSDDPDYTTGYIACKKIGYIRLPHIKREAMTGGGRIYLLNKDPEPEELATLISDLKEKAFLFESIAPIAPPQPSAELISIYKQEFECPLIHSNPE